MKISKFVSTIILTTVFSSIYLFGLIFWFYSNADSKTLSLLKDSLSTASGFFGGITTLVAAYVASRLFNDWKEQHNKQILATEAKEAFHLFHNQRNYINRLNFQCKNIIDGSNVTKLSWFLIAKDYDEKFLESFGSHKDKMSAFCFLSEGQSTYDLTMVYHNTVESLTQYLINESKQPHSDFIYLNSDSAKLLLEKVRAVDIANNNILDNLKSSYIFL